MPDRRETQAFNPSKRIEHRLKSIVHDSHSISVTNPKVRQVGRRQSEEDLSIDRSLDQAYSQRFQNFFKKVFVGPEEESKF